MRKLRRAKTHRTTRLRLISTATICLVGGWVGVRPASVAAVPPSTVVASPKSSAAPAGAFGLPQVRDDESEELSAKRGGLKASMRVRLEWGGGSPISLAETIELVGGRFDRATPLGLDDDEQASIYLLPDGKLRIEPKKNRLYRGVDLMIDSHAGPRGPIDASLNVRIEPTQTPTTIVAMDLIREPFRMELTGGNRLSVRRAPGDSLRVDTKRDFQVYQSGELVDFDITPNMPAVELDAEVRMTASITAARDSKRLWSAGIDFTAPSSDTSKWPTVPLALRMPEAEGVYDLVVELHQRSLKSRLLPDRPVERRSVQFVVLSPGAPTRPVRSTPLPLQVSTQIDPTQPHWLERFRVPGVPTLRRTPTGNCRPVVRELSTGRFVELPASGDSDDPSWQAYPLTDAQPGQPHFIDVQYPSDVPQSLGIALVEPDAPDAAVTVGVDCGLYVDPQLVPTQPAKKSHRVVVWPKTATPVLIVMNHRNDMPAVYGTITFSGPQKPSLAELPAQWLPGQVSVGGVRERATLPRSAMPHARSDGRLIAAYFDRPLLPENFGGVGGLEGDDSGRPLDDWLTFYESGRRLVEYLTYSGYNGAMITVAADGGSIYPSALLGATPRYDDGTFFVSGQDPMQKDVLEMLLRMFDREGLRLVPAVRFPARLPRFEEARRAATDEKYKAQARLQQSPDSGFIGAAYNPLDTELQAEMIAVVEELQLRYGRHPSLAGIGVQLAPEGYTQFPAGELGVDPETLPRFLAEAQISPPGNRTSPQLAAWVFGEHRDAWLSWRCEKLADFYGRMQIAAAGDDPSRKLFLVAAHCWEHPDIERRLQRSLRRGETAADMLQESGIDPNRLTRRPGVVFVRPYREAPATTIIGDAVRHELNANALLDRATLEQPAVAAMVYHEPSSLRIASLGKAVGQGPYEPRFVVQAAGDAARNRSRLAQSLAVLDAEAVFDGGWLLPPSADDVRSFAETFCALPKEKFTTIVGGPGHIAVRTLVRDGRTYLYVVNNAPWRTTVVLGIADAENQTWQGFRPNAGELAFTESNGHRWSATLEPHDVVAGFFFREDAAVNSIAATTDPAAVAALSDHLRRLYDRVAELQRAPATLPLRCGEFESAQSNDLDDSWQTRNATIAYTADQPHRGNLCGLVTASSAGTAIIGPSLPLRGTGRLTLSVWLRAVDDAQPGVRLGLRGLLDGRPYARTASIGGDRPELSADWRQFVFHIGDLPVRGLSDVRVVVELTAPGRVYIDDLTIRDLQLTEAEHAEISKRIALAEFKLGRGEPMECIQLLESYALQLPLARLSTSTSPPPANRRSASLVAAQPPAEESTTAMRERVRRYLPKFLR